ncbi:hypothetical protein IMSHALPRED_002143 [Imshaugia aleurites]|uniref:UBC core domain-containing protein n=1 Tax=Imshaugia aleurites TaxID=172621 RepID=A0A8H3PI06_9LECA|nr:hypothetical protein IMSHALPRED_002143 [Imshaugia aleurites]
MVRENVNALPTRLFAIYEEDIKRIEEQPEEDSQLAKRALSYIFCAKRPLNVEELRHALAVEVEDTELDETAFPETETLLNISAGLISIDQNSNTIRLVHYTLQEYFENNRGTLVPDSEVEMARTCLTYLSFDVFGSGPCTDGEALDQRLQTYQFLDYASHNWGHHVIENQLHERMDLVLTFLEDDQKLSSLVQVLHRAPHRANDWQDRSPLHNWHGIVREGLHFEKADHGRAFGDGVYHSLQANTSVGYSNMGHLFRYPDGDDFMSIPGEWPQSELKISQAIALNEIVNAPSQFVSRSPHLVVAQLDWIQSRYLFVRCNTHGMQLQDSPPTQVYEQDPSFTPVGEKNASIIIPVTAVSKSRRPVSQTITVKSGNKKIKVANAQELEDIAMVSDETDYEDLEIFFSETELEPPSQSNKGKGKALPKLPSSVKPDASKTDFVPGSLNHKALPLLEPPSYATSMATKALQRELTATLKVQDTHPAHELGWYIDRELINNVYQWIVELHSFESHLPLALDMKAKGIKSVVMEIRFGKNYPMSPPFVRVIRPRFLSFMAGGGGHVTAGGALCMELLTNSGWSAVSNIESVLLQVRLAMSSTDPKPARLEPGTVKDYQVGEAVEAFIRACHTHGVSTSSVTQTGIKTDPQTVGGTRRLQIVTWRHYGWDAWFQAEIMIRPEECSVALLAI